VGSTIVRLLSGGDKGTQVKDIRQTQRYWAEYLEAIKDG
jgi:putative component of toxin-antitoxin plasmid stabilization module